MFDNYGFEFPTNAFKWLVRPRKLKKEKICIYHSRCEMQLIKSKMYTGRRF